MEKQRRHTPRNYDGTKVTTHKMGDVLTSVLTKIDKSQQNKSDLILAAWPGVIGSRLAPMTKAVSFVEGVLFVKVKNSTLHSLLCQHDKFKILGAYRHRFPDVTIQKIVFRIG